MIGLLCGGWLWAGRYIYLWIYYAVFEELQVPAGRGPRQGGVRTGQWRAGPGGVLGGAPKERGLRAGRCRGMGGGGLGCR